MRALLILQLLRLMGRFGSRKRLNDIIWKDVVTPTDRPKSVRNRCAIEVFGGAFVLSLCFLEFSVGVRTFAIGLIQISFLFSEYKAIRRKSYFPVYKKYT